MQHLWHKVINHVSLNETIVNKVAKSEIPKRNLTNLLKSVNGGLFQHKSKFYTQSDGVNMETL